VNRDTSFIGGWPGSSETLKLRRIEEIITRISISARSLPGQTLLPVPKPRNPVLYVALATEGEPFESSSTNHLRGQKSFKGVSRGPLGVRDSESSRVEIYLHIKKNEVLGGS